VRHRGARERSSARRRAGPLRRRGRQRAARLLRTRSRPIRRRRYFQLVRWIKSGRTAGPARTKRSPLSRETEARRIRPAGARLEQRQSHDSSWTSGSPARSSARRFTRRRRKFIARSSKRRPSARFDDHPSLRGIWREDQAGGQLRRHREKKSGRDADLRGRDGPPDEGQPLIANVRAGRGRGGGGRGRRTPGFRRRAKENEPALSRASSSPT